jgi:hypothetical protein
MRERGNHSEELYTKREILRILYTNLDMIDGNFDNAAHQIPESFRFLDQALNSARSLGIEVKDYLIDGLNDYLLKMKRKIAGDYNAVETEKLGWILANFRTRLEGISTPVQNMEMEELMEEHCRRMSALEAARD